jgi:hypothetical protein
VAVSRDIGPDVIGAGPLCIRWMTNISKRRVEAERLIPKLKSRQQEILEEVDQL